MKTWLLAKLKHLFRCRHSWETTAVNGFFHPTEQRCRKCNQYQHIIRKARYLDREPWQPGKHPLSTFKIKNLPSH